jgi:serine phosphatase RsbU (regulator of sigma subunit)/anti-sigma regulatory factor (Ser/Thr protein kinase)
VAELGLGPAAVEARLVTRGGEAIPCLVNLSPARPGGAVPDTVIVQVQDLRERLRAEAERTERLREQLARVEAERSAERLRTIQRISDAALGTLAFDDLVHEVLARTVEALHVDTAAVVLHEGEAELVVYQATGDASVHRRTQPILDGSVLGDAVTATLETRLVVDGEEIGALHVGSLFPRRFSGSDQALLDLAADRAAAGIQRARLYQREHRIAEELQRSLLPAALPELPGLQTAARYFAAGAGSQVGGDWYDVVVQPDGRLLLVIGDVAGRGIAAAAIMGQLRSAMRAYALDGHGPASLLERLNAFQIELRARGMTTVGLISVDPATGDVRYAKAGHPPALVVDPDGATRWLTEARGIPVGAIEDTEYTEGTTTLTPGSTLVLYTDGLVEVRHEAIDEGLGRLERAAVAALDEEGEAVCDTILERTLSDPAVDDDVTLVVLRTAGPRGRAARPYPRRRADLPARRLRDDATVVALPGGPRAPGVARRALDETFAGLVEEEVLADLRIVVAEVVTNAVVHGGATEEDRIELRLAARPDLLRLEIASDGPAFELTPASPPDQPGGFGLFLLDQLSSRWGHAAEDGVVVWFEVDRAGVPAASP